MTKTEYCVSAEDVMALLDGELSAADARVISAHMEECRECAVVMEQLRGLSESLSKWNVPEVPIALEECVEKRLEKLRSRPRRGMMRLTFAPRQMWVIGGAGAIALVILLLVAVLPRPRVQKATTLTSYVAERPPEQDERRYIAPPLESTYLTTVDTNKAKSQAIAGIAGMGAQATVESLPPASTAPMIARTMSLIILVKDVGTARGSLDSILARHHGYAAHLNLGSPEDSARTMNASLRIPSTDLASAAREITALGRVMNETQSGEEVSEQHADLVARLKTARETETRFQAILAQRTGKISDVLEVEQSIAHVRGEIERMEAEQKALEHRVDFASVDVQLMEEYKAPLAPPAANSVSTQIHNAFAAGYQHAADTLLGIVLFAEEYAPPVLIWLTILGLPAFALWRRYKKVRTRP
jgi:anti-sigma factor RsiW/uncharacterized small protein (DUF1192 family)